MTTLEEQGRPTRGDTCAGDAVESCAACAPHTAELCLGAADCKQPGLVRQQHLCSCEQHRRGKGRKAHPRTWRSWWGRCCCRRGRRCTCHQHSRTGSRLHRLQSNSRQVRHRHFCTHGSRGIKKERTTHTHTCRGRCHCRRGHRHRRRRSRQCSTLLHHRCSPPTDLNSRVPPSAHCITGKVRQLGKVTARPRALDKFCGS